MFKVKISTGRKAHPRAYPVFLGRDLLDRLGFHVSAILPACPILVVSDAQVAPHYGERCLLSLRRAGFNPSLVVLEGGEKEKTPATVQALYTRALEAGLSRDGAMLALGGGVIGDLTGFVAATYMRGIPYVQVPTTLLAMVDSSVGGKVGVNHPLGKNLIGAFHHPVLVAGDTSTLYSLPAREFNAGLAELVKYGIIWDEKLFARLESLAFPGRGGAAARPFLTAGNPRLLGLIARAVRIKGEIVCRDEREADLRRILNFGHTFGHALEAATGYSYFLHGEAVACGMGMAVRLAVLLKLLDPLNARRINRLLGVLPVPPPPPGLSGEVVFQSLDYDKKKQAEKLVFILPAAPGLVQICKSPPPDLVRQVIAEYLQGVRSQETGARSQETGARSQ
jgi:3-dehydroquinate synthase